MLLRVSVTLRGSIAGGHGFPPPCRLRCRERLTVTGDHMAYTLGEAARAAGRSKPTIARAIHSGRLSATRREDGSYHIDPAELQRVYPVTGNGNGTMKRSVPGERDSDGSEHLAARVLEQAETIRDLRARLDVADARLDAESEERRKAQAQMTALLADQRPDSAPATPWRRFLAWRQGR